MSAVSDFDPIPALEPPAEPVSLLELVLPDPKEVAALAKRLRRMQKVALQQRRMFYLTMDFSKGKVDFFKTQYVGHRPFKQSGTSEEEMWEMLDKATTRAERALPLGWTLDADSLAEALLTVMRNVHPKFLRFSFRADFRRIADKKLFGCWIDGTGQKGHNLGVAKSVNATAAVAEAFAIARAGAPGLPDPPPPPAWMKMKAAASDCPF